MENESKIKDFIRKDIKRKSNIGKISSFVVFLNDFSDLANRLGSKGFEIIGRYFDRLNPKHALISSTNPDDINLLSGNEYQLIVSSEPLNNLISINEFLAAVNTKLESDGTFICRFVPQSVIEKNLINKYIFPINKIMFCKHYLFHRVFPKLSLTRKLYFKLTKGKNRSIRKLEMHGRLNAGGFRVHREYQADNFTYFTVKKQGQAYFDQFSSYGLLFKMKRIGKGGKEIKVYKLRTMVPFSEYLQEEFVQKNQLDKGGKICNDIRVTTLGKIMRKLWIDEIPNIVNLIKGEMKIVGVRPLSKQYLSLYSPELQKLREKIKPGIIPPFYVDLPETLEEIQESERKYINSYLQKPIRTDCNYFFKALGNILFKRLTSK